jgi:hypothetical protein
LKLVHEHEQIAECPDAMFVKKRPDRVALDLLCVIHASGKIFQNWIRKNQSPSRPYFRGSTVVH